MLYLWYSHRSEGVQSVILLNASLKRSALSLAGNRGSLCVHTITRTCVGLCFLKHVQYLHINECVLVGLVRVIFINSVPISLLWQVLRFHYQTWTIFVLNIARYENDSLLDLKPSNEWKKSSRLQYANEHPNKNRFHSYITAKSTVSLLTCHGCRLH